MPSFKPKTVKKIKINKKNSTTLDGKHKEFVNEFNKDENDRIPLLKKEKIEIKSILEKNSLENTLTIEHVMDYRDKLEEITNEIKQLKSKKIDYFLDNSKYIFDYFENKKDISAGNTTTSKNKMLESFFKMKPQDNSSVIERKNNNIFQKYLNNIDESFLDINAFLRPTDVCQTCFKGELIPMDDEGVLICNACFKNFQYLIENEKPSYKEPPKEVCFYAYKKINHFKEILAQFQGKETTQIPAEVIDNLKHQIKKERVEYSKLTYYKTKEILKKLGYNKYYEHINFIKDKLGIKPPIISQELEETLCNFFMEIQYPYAKHCPDYRVNFLHYYYVLYKLFELLDETQYLPEIPMLKDREKLIEQDTIWKKICEELDWEFIATI
uniref:Viral late gene transcription factor 3 zinc ribbon domain-containing protein n=1 Tax=viral metagenome TaxID=1070528 RepID=A0A6C0K193_9ZZZZ